jgi:hypothetical protein
MISLAFRTYLSAPAAVASVGSRRARTSCWVMVEAPRSPAPLALSPPPRGSPPRHNRCSAESPVLGRCGRVEDEGGTSAKVTTRRSSRWKCQLDLARPVVEDRRLGERAAGARTDGQPGRQNVDAVLKTMTDTPPRGRRRGGARSGRGKTRGNADRSWSRRMACARSATILLGLRPAPGVGRTRSGRMGVICRCWLSGRQRPTGAWPPGLSDASHQSATS